MRDTSVFVSTMLTSMILAASAHAQSAPPSAPVAAAEITLEELNKARISVALTFKGNIRWSGDGVLRPWTFNWRTNISLGQAGAVKWTLNALGNNEVKTFPSNYSLSATINKPDTTKDNVGERAIVWAYEKNTLTLLRVFQVGGRRIQIILSRSGAGFSCVARGAYMTERGAGVIRHQNSDGSGTIELSNMVLTSARCSMQRN